MKLSLHAPFRAAVTVTLILVSAAACSGVRPKASESTVSKADVSVTKSHGTTVRLTDGATLVIPPGAVSSNGRLIARTGGRQAGTDVSAEGQLDAARPVLVAAGTQATFKLTGATLVRDARLTIRVNPAALQMAGNAATGPGAVWLAFYDASGHRWQRVDSQYDPVTHSVSASIAHFSLWAPFTFAWQQIGSQLRQALASLLSERATPAACPGVADVVVSESSGQDGPAQGCASQANSNELSVTITSNRGYAMIVPTPAGVTPAPPEYTGYDEFLRTRPDAVQKLGGEYLAPKAGLTYTMPLYGPPVTFTASASVKTYLLDVGILLTTSILNVGSLGLSDCILNNVANSSALPLSAAPKLLIECMPIISGATREAWSALGDFVAALAFAKAQVGAVLDLNGDARSNFTGKIQVKRAALPLPDFYYATAVLPESLYVHPAYPSRLGIDNSDWIDVQAVNSWDAANITITGVLHHDTCQPDCASGQMVTYPVQVVGSTPQTCTVQIGEAGSGTSQAAYVFSQISVRALSGSPPSYLVGDSVFHVCGP